MRPSVARLRRQALGALALAAIAGLAGCAPAPLLKPPLAPATADHSLTARQLVTVTTRGHSARMQVVIKLDPRRLRLIGLSPIGGRAFTLTETADGVRLTGQSAALDDIDPERVLSDLQLAYWPLAVLRRALPGELRLQQIGSARLIWRHARLVWLAAAEAGDRWHRPVTIYNARLGYRLAVRPLDLGTARPYGAQRAR